MSLQPIDLQTLFVRLDHVGKQEGLLRNGVAQSQNVVGQEIAKESDKAEKTVTSSEDLGDGSEMIHDDDEQQGMRRRETSKQRGKAKPEEDETELFRDPDLGQNVDLSGSARTRGPFYSRPGERCRHSRHVFLFQPPHRSTPPSRENARRNSR